MNGRLMNLLAGVALSSVAMFAGTVSISGVGGGDGTTYTGPYTATVGNVSGVTVVCDDDNDEVANFTANEISLSQVSSDLSQTMFGAELEAEVNNYNSIHSTTYTAQAVATEIYEAVGYLVLSLVKLSPTSTQAIDTQYAIWDLMNDTSGNTVHPSSSNLYIDIDTIFGVGTTFSTSSVQSADAGASYAASALSYVETNGVANTAHVNTLDASGLEILSPTNYSATCSGSAPNEKCTFSGTPTQELWTVTPEPATYALFGLGLILLSFGTFRRTRKNN